jgi:hypothetical protein
MLINERYSWPIMASGKIDIPASAKQLSIISIGVGVAVRLNQEWHSRLPIYKTGFCLNASICFAAEFKGVYFAIAIWSNPVAANIPQDTWIELRRLAIAPDAPKFTATFMLGRMAKIIKKEMPLITTLVSYQDIEAHSGTIYKAANWIADKSHTGGSWNRPNAKNMNGRPRTRPDSNKATGPKQRWIYRIRKDRPCSSPSAQSAKS